MQVKKNSGKIQDKKMLSKIANFFKRKNTEEKIEKEYPVFKRQKVDDYNYQVHTVHYFDTKVTKTIDQVNDILEDEYYQDLLDKKSTLDNTVKMLEDLHAPQKAIDAIREFSDEIGKQQETRHRNVLKRLNEIADTDYFRKMAQMTSNDVDEDNDVDYDDISDFNLDADVVVPEVTSADVDEDDDDVGASDDVAALEVTNDDVAAPVQQIYIYDDDGELIPGFVDLDEEDN